MAEEWREEPDDLEQPPSFFPYTDEETTRPDFEPGEPVRCEVEAVFAAQSDKLIQRYVLLTDGERKFPIMIGAFEASAITYAIENHRPDRPLTHDLMRNMMEQLGGTIVRVVIDDLWHDTYYAKIYVRTEEREFVLDSRPSDAIAMAVRTDAPIFVVEGILNQNDR